MNSVVCLIIVSVEASVGVIDACTGGQNSTLVIPVAVLLVECSSKGRSLRP